MDAESYMREIVDPTINDFEANPRSRRHAFVACLVTCHCADYLALPRKAQQLRNELKKQSMAFSMIDRVAHAFKHVQSGHVNSPQDKPLNVTAVFERPPALAGVAQCGLSRCGDPVGGVEVWGEDTPDLLHAVKKAAEFLHTKCRK
jgi:hypothetical protein